MALTDIITVDWLKRIFLFGINLTDDAGDPYPDDLYEHAIDTGIAMMDAELDVQIDGNRRFRNERHDTSDWEADTWYLMMLDNRPVSKVTTLGVQFGEFPKADLPASWVHISSDIAGQIQIIPGPEGFHGFSLSGGAVLIGADYLSIRPYTPRWFVFDYEAGFEKDLDGTVNVEANSAVVTGFGTDLSDLSGLRKRSYLKINGEVKRILSLDSDTQLTMDSVFASSGTGLTVRWLDYDPAIIECIGIIASLLPLDTAGDLIIGAGISNLSLSVDALSQSIGTTSGIENSGYGAREIQYRKRLKELLKAIKRRYASINMVVL